MRLVLVDRMFCEHGNIIGSCRECTPERYKAKISAQILEDVDCPVWELLRRKEDDESIPAERCNNSGVKIGTTSQRHLILECTDCGWDWRRWKVSELDEVATLPKLVRCEECDEIRIEKNSARYKKTCTECSRRFFRDRKQ